MQTASKRRFSKILEELPVEKLWAFFATSFRHVTCQDVFGSIKISMPELPTAFAILAFRATQNMMYMNTLVQSMLESCSVHQQALTLMASRGWS